MVVKEQHNYHNSRKNSKNKIGMEENIKLKLSVDVKAIYNTLLRLK